MLRALMGFEHCVRNVPDTWLASSGYKITRYSVDAGNGKGIIVNEDGWLTSPIAGTAPYRQLEVIDFSQFMAKQGAGWIHVGFRARLEAIGWNPNDLICWLDHGNGTSATPSLYWYHLFPAGSQVGREVHVQFSINLTTGGFETYFDGVLAGTSSISAGNLAGMRTGLFTLVLSTHSAGVAGVAAFRDFWITDDIPGDGYTGRLGARRIYPVTADAVSGSGWTSSDGADLLATLNTSPEKAGAAIINSASNAGELEISLNANVPAGRSIDAVQLLVGAQGSNSTSRTASRFKRGGQYSAQRIMPLTAALQYGLPVGVMTRTPDGQRLTNTTLNDTVVCFTPD